MNVTSFHNLKGFANFDNINSNFFRRLFFMQNFNKQKVLSIVFGTYILCYVFRIFEYFVLRTDQTLIGEAIVHKLLELVFCF